MHVSITNLLCVVAYQLLTICKNSRKKWYTHITISFVLFKWGTMKISETNLPISWKWAFEEQRPTSHQNCIFIHFESQILAAISTEKTNKNYFWTPLRKNFVRSPHNDYHRISSGKNDHIRDFFHHSSYLLGYSLFVSFFIYNFHIANEKSLYVVYNKTRNILSIMFEFSIIMRQLSFFKEIFIFFKLSSSVKKLS